MGASHLTNYAKGLQFVQNLNDDNFGEVDVYRNQQGKFIMKCTKSFITGDKRHSDFIKVLEFIKTTQNSNIIPVSYMEQYQQSNVCISYQKLQLYSEYLNFTLQGLIKNKKTVQEAQIWYLLKTMLILIKDLQQVNMKMNFSLSNIFLTLKGIPSVFLYHFFMDNSKEPTLQFENNQYKFVKENDMDSQTKDDNFFVQQNQQQQNLTHQQQQITLKPYCMHFCLAKIILQLVNMHILPTEQNDNEVHEIKRLLFSTLKQKNRLGKIVKSLLNNPKNQQVLDQIKYLQDSHQIKLSTEIRFNKFRYIMAEEEKPQKDLTLNENNLLDFKSKPITPINTPIYRLRQPDHVQSSRKQFGIKSKLLMSEQQFFKKKTNQKIMDFKKTNKINQSSDQSHNFTSEKIQGRTKAYSIGGKENSSHFQEQKRGRGSKLSLVGNSRNLSTSKLNRNPSTSEQYFSSNPDYNQLGLAFSRQFHSHQLGIQAMTPQPNLPDQSSISISNMQPAKQKPSRELKSTNRMKEILNEQIMKSKQQFMSVKKSTLLTNKIHEQQSYKLTSKHPQKIKDFFKSQQLPQQHTKSEKQQLSNKQQQFHKLYKPYVTEIEPQFQDCQDNQQKVKQIHTLSNQKHSQMKESVNALDRSNFLSTLELKKSRNNLKVKQITQRKDSIMLDLPMKKLSKGSYQQTENIKQYLRQKIQTKSTQIKQRKALDQKNISQNMSSDRITQIAMEKKKIKLRNDNLNEKSFSNPREKDQNKENKTHNFDQMKIMGNSKLRKVSIRAKGQSIK